MYFLQLLTGNMLLASILGMPATTLQPATPGREPTWTASPPTVSEMPAPPTGIKWWCHLSDWEATMLKPEEQESVGLDVTPAEWPCQRQKEGNPLASLHKESHWEALGKDSKLVWATRQVYFKSHCPNYDHEGFQDLSYTFKEMATSAGLLGSDVHKVQPVWAGWKDLWFTHHMAKSSPKNIHLFYVVPSTKLPKIMGLKGIHSPKALKWQSGLSFCLWCGKEGQNEGVVVNHLQMSHYHLGIICGQCLEYFTTSSGTMCHHLQLWKLALASVNDDDDQEEVSSIDDNGEDDDDFAFG